MTKSDLDLLLEMGFEKARAELAVKKTGGCKSLINPRQPMQLAHTNTVQGALTWLEENQDKPLEELQAAEATAATTTEDSEAGPSIPSGQTAASLVCNDCGKKFRSHAEASYHASKTYES
jgi:predicted RNA-binding Zn-ribbon protein involved in translation (DUF1610 family)